MDVLLASYFLSGLLFTIGMVSGYWIDAGSFLVDLQQQTDLLLEGTYTNRMRSIYEIDIGTDVGIDIPRVFYSTRDILILTKQPGSHPDVMELGHETMEAIHRKSGGLFVYMAVIHGFCHGDVHTGNMLFDPSSQCLSIIDFGSCIVLPPFGQNPLLSMLNSLQCSLGVSTRNESQEGAFLMFFPSATYESEYGPIMCKIVNIAWFRDVDVLLSAVLGMAKQYSLVVDSDIIHFFMQMNRVMDVINTMFYSTSDYASIVLLFHEAMLIAEQSISPFKKLHVAFLLGVTQAFVAVTPRMLDMHYTSLLEV
jgi:serine/threonine protein kinase